MESAVIESEYPITFRQDDADELGRCLKLRSSMEIIGMKRVGISNFLRFFLSHKNIPDEYIKDNKNHLLVAIDLNDLVEREIFPFWTLTLKRIADSVDQSAAPAEIKKRIQLLFLNSIQSRDLFLLIDNIRMALIILVENDIYPTLFFLRFDRMKDVFNVTFFDNLKGLRDAASEKVAYVFTSYRSLNDLFPTAKPSLSSLSQTYYIKPAKISDMAVIYSTYKKRYALLLPTALEQELFSITGGNVQYMQLAVIIFNELTHKKLVTKDDLLHVLISDERVTMQSEELWESLTAEEKRALLEVAKGEKVKENSAEYLWESGFIRKHDEKLQVFSPLLANYLLHLDNKDQRKTEIVHLTRKENLLFGLLESHLGDICERDEIIEQVWPEYREFGVSDWAIDRLIAQGQS